MAGGAQTKKLQRVVKNLKLRSLGQFFLQRMNGTLFYRNRGATAETGEVVAVFCGQGIDPLTIGLSPGLNQPFDLQGSQCPVDCGQPGRLWLGLQLLVDNLGGHGPISVTEQGMDLALAAGQARLEVSGCCHESRTKEL